MTVSLRSYLIGFLLCLLLTIAAFLSRSFMLIIAYALIQALVQLVLFLHLGREPKWHLMAFLCMVSILLILVLGSLWIMHNLHYRVM